MTNARKVKAENLESTIYQLIKEGYDTVPLISDKLAFSRTYTSRVLNIMAYKGDIYRHEEKKANRIYYTTGFFPANDPFNLTGLVYE